jgi:hypothetical protein
MVSRMRCGLDCHAYFCAYFSEGLDVVEHLRSLQIGDKDGDVPIFAAFAGGRPKNVNRKWIREPVIPRGFVLATELSSLQKSACETI